MNATITYKMATMPHPWNPQSRKDGVKCWCLVKVIKPEIGESTEEPVAIFNYDSEAQTFQGHIIANKLSPALIRVDRDVEELYRIRGIRG